MIKKALKPIADALRGGFLYILSGSVLVRAITMISSILLARLVSKQLYAYYAYATNLYAYVELLNGLELSGGLLVLCAKAKSREEGGAYFLYCARLGPLIQLIVSCLLCLVVSYASITYPQARHYFYLYLPIPMLSCLIVNIQAYNRACLQNKRFSAMGVARAAVLTVLALILVPLLSVDGIIYARYVACFTAIAVGGWFCVKNLRGVHCPRLTPAQKKRLYKTSLSLLVGGVFAYIMPINETMLVNNLIANETVTANFKVAGLIPQQLQLVSGGICVYFYPLVARGLDYLGMRKKIVRIGLYTASAVTLVAVAGMLLTPLMISILYGEAYIDAIPLSRILWIMRLADCALRTVPVTFLPALGDSKFNVVASPIFCAMHVAIDYVMITRYGIAGVAYATIIAYALMAACAWIYLWRYCAKRAKDDAIANKEGS